MEIQLSKDIFHKHSGTKYAYLLMEENARLGKSYKQQFGADLFWRTSKTGCCSPLSYGLASATRLTHSPYMIKPSVLLGVHL